ncbi:MAG: transcriptional repressor LexA [Armatimonadota bacterium]
MGKKELTPRRQEILDFIVSYIDDNGYPPTVREIGEKVGLSSSSSVHFHLKALEASGYLQRDGSLTRAIRPIVDDDDASSASTSSPLQEIPLIGRVAAGEPIFASQNTEDVLPMPATLFPDSDLFMLEIKGDSMINAGILDGDYVVVQAQETAENGDIIVALMQDEATVKRFYRRNDHIELQPENDDMEPIRASDVQVVGRVRGVVRRMR